MNPLQLIMSSGAFATPLSWQAETSLLMLATLLFCAPHIIDSIRKFRELDHEHDEEHDHDNEEKQHPH